jgi:hypothetical protein
MEKELALPKATALLEKGMQPFRNWLSKPA